MADDKIVELRREIDQINQQLLLLLADRQDVSVAIGALKVARGLPLYSEDREAELLETFRRDATRLDLDPDYVEEFMRVILEHSRAAQRRKVSDDS